MFIFILFTGNHIFIPRDLSFNQFFFSLNPQSYCVSTTIQILLIRTLISKLCQYIGKDLKQIKYDHNFQWGDFQYKRNQFN
ncbi:hypothetical protein pb186bvf_016109 [Paramecium bursaria]